MTAIRLRGPGDVLASIPYQLGYHPSDSVVVLGLHDGAVELVERLDLPEPAGVVDAAAALVGPLVRERIEAVLLAGFESSAELAAPMLDALVGPLCEAEIAVLERLVVRDGRWFSLDCTQGCCPPEGQPLPEPASTPAVADFVGQGVSPLPDRAQVAATVRADPAVSDLVAIELAKDEAPGRPAAARRMAWLSLWAVVCRSDPDRFLPEELSAPDVAELVHSLRDIELRDALIAWLCPGSLPLEALPDDLVDAVGSALSPRSPASSGTLAAAAARVLRGRLEWLARAVPDPDAAPVLTMLATVAWHLGDGTVARVALDRALEHAPDYRLAQLIARLIDLGIRPGVAARSTATRRGVTVQSPDAAR
ncbi:DUF4192 domain-containing protein [Nostocoides sp. HKS02]|uniref:DUF4192 domain-containing protein n=1 Tax=Nostocoides sp. HKS02 TaxID=1813880 RepID=UPI0012B4EA74|nr:DUF4192 domain-containing protein [Tetrasphaera sp. HKS02]QGN57643.1 DUF4192 family protein [Tetrasphaera sp. HKS02]